MTSYCGWCSGDLYTSITEVSEPSYSSRMDSSPLRVLSLSAASAFDEAGSAGIEGTCIPEVEALVLELLTESPVQLLASSLVLPRFITKICSMSSSVRWRARSFKRFVLRRAAFRSLLSLLFAAFNSACWARSSATRPTHPLVTSSVGMAACSLGGLLELGDDAELVLPPLGLPSGTTSTIGMLARATGGWV